METAVRQARRFTPEVAAEGMEAQHRQDRAALAYLLAIFPAMPL
jgi:hypothetical protein